MLPGGARNTPKGADTPSAPSRPVYFLSASRPMPVNSSDSIFSVYRMP